jgi:lactoylglutathione lyase
MAHFSFTKVVVDDLEASAAFYTATFGLEEQFRVDGEIAGLEMSEIVYAPTAEGAGRFILMRYAGPTGAPAGVVPGFRTDDIDALFARGVAAGGHVALAPADRPEYGHRIGFLRDPEGRLIEIAQPLG